MKRNLLFIGLLLLFSNTFAQEVDERLIVLKKGIIGREFVFGKWDEKNGTETHLKYLGTVATSAGKKYKILTSVWLWGLSKRATNRILIYSAQNKYIGNYKLTMKADLPVRMDNGILKFLKIEDDGENRSTEIDLTKGIPKEMFIAWDDHDGDTYVFDRTYE